MRKIGILALTIDPISWFSVIGPALTGYHEIPSTLSTTMLAIGYPQAIRAGMCPFGPSMIIEPVHDKYPRQPRTFGSLTSSITEETSNMHQ